MSTSYHMKNNRLALVLIGMLAIAILAGAAHLYTNKTEIDQSAKKEKSKKHADHIAGAANTCYGGHLESEELWELPKELLEISGIAWLNENRVAAIEDNLGTIFIYNLANKKIENRLRFGPGGDYEGIAYVKGSYWVIRSDGHLFEVSAAGKLIKEHQLPLTATDNIEILHYDAPNNRLILGQKDGKKGASQKNCYAFNLSSKKFNTAPIFSLDLNDSVIACRQTSDSGNKKNKKKKGAVIRPSELAIHPLTSEIYIADGPNQRVLVLSADAKPKYYLSLDKNRFPQVEGLMFSPKGELYVSTEGTKNPAKIARMQIVAK